MDSSAPIVWTATAAERLSTIARGSGPCNSAELLVAIADRLAERMDDVIEGLGDQADALEEQLDQGQPKQLNAALADLRRTFIGLRRYLVPQRDALLRLAAVQVSWLAEDNKMRLRDVADQTTRLQEAMEAARDQAAVSEEELLQRLSEKTEQRLYLLSVITAVFLPLGLITGLLGVNVGGIPGSEDVGAGGCWPQRYSLDIQKQFDTGYFDIHCPSLLQDGQCRRRTGHPRSQSRHR